MPRGPDPTDPVAAIEGGPGKAVGVVKDQGAFFDDPLGYREVASGIQHVEAARTLALHTFRGNERVIDIGSGDGSFTAEHILAKVPHGLVVGIDRSNEGVAQAYSDYVEGRPNPRLSFFTGDITDRETYQDALGQIVGNPAEFDVVFSNSTLHHIYEEQALRRALHNMARLTAEEGVVILSFAGRGNFRELIGAGMNVAREFAFEGLFDEFDYPLLLPDEAAFESMLRDAGLEPEHLKLEPLTIMLPDSDVLRRFCRGCMASFMTHLDRALEASAHPQPERTKEIFADRMAERFLERTGWKVGSPIAFPEVNLEVRARKISA